MASASRERGSTRGLFGEVSVLFGCVLVLLLLGSLASRATAQVVINEVLASNVRTGPDEDGDPSDWVELLNRGATPISLEGYTIRDELDELTPWAFPSVTLSPGGRLLVWCSEKDRRAFDADTLGAPDSTIPFAPWIVSLDDEWSYLVGLPEDGAPPPDWSEPAFDDSAWPRGLPGFGFGDDDDRTELPLGLSAVFLRRRFTLDDLGGLTNLVLQIHYDDAFVAYINGTRVLSANFPDTEEPTFASQALRSVEARRRYRYDLSPFADLLQAGENVLAMVAINSSPTSNDLSLIPELGSVPVVLHTDFALDADGERVILAAPDGEIVDFVVFDRQYDDQSFGRSPDGVGEFRYLLNPTPGSPNTGPSSETPLVVADTRFEPDRGFYSEPIAVSITSETTDAEIRYTLDGSAPTESHGLVYDGPILVDDTTTIRAFAHRDGLKPTNVDTHTYLYLETAAGGGVLNQPRLPAGFPSTWGARTADYEMDPRVATDTASRYYDPRVVEGLLSLPSLSIVMDLDDLFDPQTGIYSNSRAEGPEWERPTSVELIHPDGSRGFQVNAGLRMQGNASRSPDRPKHNMRLLFKRIYGAGKLEHPLFEDSPVDEFDTIILRGGNGDSWFHPNVTQQQRAQYIRDQWHRDVQMTMGHLTTHQVYLHLYINGLYWGLYHVFERPNASFLASYLGGDEEDYDSRNAREVVDGDLDAWNTMWGIANAGVSTPEAYDEIRQYLDVPNLIDFLLINFYSGNVDWDTNNWFGGRRREPGAGFQFFVWDAERTFWNFNENRTTLNNASRPTGVHQRLRANLDYRVLFADHVRRHLFDDGVLTPSGAESRWLARAEEIESALSAEAARWGDNKRPAAPYTRDVEWAAELESLLRDFFPRRTALVLGQLRSQSLYPAVEAPTLSRRGGPVPAGTGVEIRSSEETVLYTVDGSDPRLPGGAISQDAREWTGAPVLVDTTLRLRARARAGGEWSALTEAVFVVPESFPLRITEIHYHPASREEDGELDSDDFEFIELANLGAETLDLSGVRLEGGVTHDFGTVGAPRLAAGAIALLVESLDGFRRRYGAGLPVVGEYRGRLSDRGELLRLRGPLDETVFEVTYSDAWYPETDGAGHSLVLDLTDLGVIDASDADDWRPSFDVDGSPGFEDIVDDRGGLQVPADGNQDGRLDLSDVLTLARRLFGGEVDANRCDGVAEERGREYAHADTNGDGQIDITDVVGIAVYLFSGGQAPFLGVECRRFRGCEDVCSQ